jgi:benzoyl-CoA 2,3-dioxygenase component B
MLTEEAHHMFVGETGVARVIDRTVHLMRENKNEDARQLGGIDLPTIQRYLNLWYSVSADLFGGEISSNAADYFASGLKGRYQEERYADHLGLEGSYPMTLVENGRLAQQQVPLRNALNEVLRDAYIQDCQRGVDRWNRILRAAKIDFEFKLPDRKFHRQVGLFAGHHFTPEGMLIGTPEWQERRDAWLPSAADLAFVQSLMHPVRERGQIANWIAPARGVSGRPFDFDYVRLN